MSEKICSSADKPLEEFLKNCGEDTSHHRMVAQQNKCGFGLKGVCCRLCSNGPCRLSPAKPKGVCGADADTIACRNFLRQVAAGSGCYTHVVENTAKRLKELALDYKKQNKKLRNKDSLAKLAKMLDIACKGNCGKCGCQCVDSAVIVADAVLEDLRRPIEEKMELLEKIALPKRYETWKKLGILPGGAKDEIFNAVVKTSTNLNSDPMDMLLQCLRLGISTGNYGLILTNLMNDIIMSPPKITMDPVGLRIIDPEYINIMITGHQQSMFVDLQEKLETEVIQVTFIEGKRLTDYAKVIENKFGYKADDVISYADSDEFVDKMISTYDFITEDIKQDGIYHPLEGYLFADTYDFKKNATIDEILNKMIYTMGKKLEVYKDDINVSKFSVHELLTLASIVELEGANSEDRAGVAGVFYNRIEAGWPLGSDATTYYAVNKDFTKDLTNNNLTAT